MNLLFRQYQHQDRHRHEADPADLDQSQDHALTEYRPVREGVKSHQAGDAGSRCGREKAVGQTAGSRSLRGHREHEQRRADHDNGKIASQNQLHGGNRLPHIIFQFRFFTVILFHFHHLCNQRPRGRQRSSLRRIPVHGGAFHFYLNTPALSPLRSAREGLPVPAPAARLHPDIR